MKKVFLFLFLTIPFLLLGQNIDSLKTDSLQNLDTFNVVKKDSIILKADTSQKVSVVDTMQLIDTESITQGKSIDTTSQRILLIGDSMVGGLSYAMQDYCDYNNHKFLAVAWESAQTKWFAKTDTLEYFIKTFKPTYIFILLGANEVYLKDYEKYRGKYVDEILKKIDTIPFVWLGPPNWNNDTALNLVIQKHVGKDKFFPSYKITLHNPKFKRWSDGIHPALSGDRMWMDSLATWVMSKSHYPIILSKPDTYRKKPKANLKILKPLPKSIRNRL